MMGRDERDIVTWRICCVALQRKKRLYICREYVGDGDNLD
jgi:hypothetical protein